MTESVEYPQRIAVSRNGMVSTQHPCATSAGVEMLAAGGNAVDAAVAAAFALGVCEPQASGLGGQTMLQVHMADSRRTFSVDGSSRAPSRAVVEDFSARSDRIRGYGAATVPSTPAVLAYMAEKYGRMPLARLMEPAIRIAREGYPIPELQHRLQVRELNHFLQGGAGEAFLKNGNTPYHPGDIFSQPVLAGTLEEIAAKGVASFYRGDIAARIEEDMIANGGFVRRDDLANIPWPIERKPVGCRFAGMRISTFPPPGAGRTLVEMCNILSQFDAKAYDLSSLKGLTLIAEVIRRAQLDRRDRPFDPNFYPQVQDRRMLSTEYARLAAKQLKSRLPKSGGDTTHLSVMDSFGNVVALTQSIERVYGSFRVTPDLGFLYNNYMSAFDYSDITHPYYLRANGVPWASVAPTIAFRGKRPVLAIGSPGSERIASSILQVLIRLVAGQSPLDAVSAPRLHCSINGRVTLEASRIRNDLPAYLEKRGFKIREKEPFAFYLGCIQMVMRVKDGFAGVADPRRDGSAGAPVSPLKTERKIAADSTEGADEREFSD